MKALLLIAAMAGSVPNPIPPDFNKCVWAIATPKGIKHGFKKKMVVMRPPLTRSDHAYLEYWRREKLAILQLCNDSPS
jgi:hypothetical protein